MDFLELSHNANVSLNPRAAQLNLKKLPLKDLHIRYKMQATVYKDTENVLQVMKTSHKISV